MIKKRCWWGCLHSNSGRLCTLLVLGWACVTTACISAFWARLESELCHHHYYCMYTLSEPDLNQSFVITTPKRQSLSATLPNDRWECEPLLTLLQSRQHGSVHPRTAKCKHNILRLAQKLLTLLSPPECLCIMWWAAAVLLFQSQIIEDKVTRSCP